MSSLNDVAILGCGNFWLAQEALGKLSGVHTTTAGYTGGTSSNPSYHAIGDHSEVVRVEYDPRALNFESILRHFFSIHDPTAAVPHNHRSVIFYIDELQKHIALRFLDLAKQYHGEALSTSVEPAGVFHPAESYHQQFLTRLAGGQEGI